VQAFFMFVLSIGIEGAEAPHRNYFTFIFLSIFEDFDLLLL
jgi:hypothetical protein